MEETKIMRRMRKGNSSSEFALNMPAGERQRRGAAYCMSVGRLFPPVSFGACAASRAADGGGGGQRGGRGAEGEEEKSVPQAVSRRVRLGVELLVAATHVRVGSG